MKNMIRTVMIAIATSALAMMMSAYADQSTDKRTDIMKLVEMSGMDQLLESGCTRMMAEPIIGLVVTPDGKVSSNREEVYKFIEDYDKESLFKPLVDFFDKEYTHDEIKDILTFYSTSAYKKLGNEKNMAAMNQALQAGMEKYCLTCVEDAEKKFKKNTE